MNYRIITEDGREIKRFETERQAERFWDNFNGIYTGYDEKTEEYYTTYIYIEKIAG